MDQQLVCDKILALINAEYDDEAKVKLEDIFQEHDIPNLKFSYGAELGGMVSSGKSIPVEQYYTIKEALK